MTYITGTLTIIVTLCLRISGYPYDSGIHIREYTREIVLKQGRLQGVVASISRNPRLPLVEQYKGIPYAAAPVGDMRFMPSNSAPSWFGTKIADTFGPVCPQRFPNITLMSEERKRKFLKLKEQLQNESEDCLYLNIYAPYKENSRSTRKYPVMVFIHGESFEWNSGNPYDGSVLAAYGNVIVVTLNFRLGVLGFLKVDTFQSNFGLVDQVAALLWINANIAAFGGDPNTVTLFGHGTGAVCASLLMLSPMVINESKLLFQRAILMGGTALSDWALAGNPESVAFQVAQALNCQIQDDFAKCLRRKRLDEIMAATVVTPPYKTQFGPVVDNIAIPNDPQKSMTTFKSLFRGFELMYGVTELESIHLLNPDALKLGMLEEDRNQELRKYLRVRCEMRSELCVTWTLAEYDSDFTLDEKYGGYTGHEPDRASLSRDLLLDIFSDARTVAPMVQMAKYHAAVNQQSYFYVFAHKSQGKEYINNKSYNGEEMPYVFGVPLGGTNIHLDDHYNDKERLFSEIIMTYFCNFAYTGDPNMPRRNEYQNLGIQDWSSYDVDWPEYDLDQQRYLHLAIPPYILSHYRDKEMTYWNNMFPSIAFNKSYAEAPMRPQKTVPPPPKRKQLPPWILTNPPSIIKDNFNRYSNFSKPLQQGQVYGVVKSYSTGTPDNMVHKTDYGSIVYEPSENANNKNMSTTITIAVGSVFLILNIFVLLLIYLRRHCRKKLRTVEVKSEEPNGDVPRESADGCNIVKMVRKSSKSDDTYEAVRAESNEKVKLPRQMSNSTIDAHTKVRDWITNEIIYKYSPRILRRPREVDRLKDMKQDSSETTPLNDNSSTLGRSPTRPVSPSDNFKTPRPILVKSSSIPVQKIKNKPEKISVAIDATPSGRGNSVLQQQPIELLKSLDLPDFDVPLRRSLTLEDFSHIPREHIQELRKSSTSINLKPFNAPTVVRIEHSHSKSEPVQDIYSGTSQMKKLKTFDPSVDVNVTSRDENIQTTPLTPEESLQIIKRRNFPKVLPDYPTKEALAKKRRSMPAPNHYISFPDQFSQPNSPINKSFNKFAPHPPPRTTSTLSRKPHLPPQPLPSQLVCQSAPMLAEEPPTLSEPEVACNNLYVGPLIPKLTKTEMSSSENSKLNTNPIYDSLKPKLTFEDKKVKTLPKTIVTADPTQPIKKIEPKVIIKPTMTRSISDPKKNIPRVMVHDNVDNGSNTQKTSQIPTPIKQTQQPQKESSSSESSPSEESDTGTVVKRL